MGHCKELQHWRLSVSPSSEGIEELWVVCVCLCVEIGHCNEKNKLVEWKVFVLYCGDEEYGFER